MYSILKKEITSYLSSLVAYVTIGVFLLVLGLFLWVFPESSILEYGYAGLDSLFSTAPYLFMFLIPAITMRSLAEERKEGTFELLLTRPLTDGQIVLGKFFACVLLVLFALLPTLVYYYTVYHLGNPQGNIDSGAVIGSYIGLFLLGSSFAAIGLFASSISKNQIIAFTIAVFLCFFFYTGFDSLSTLLSLQNLGLESLGITNHYDSVSRGVLDTRDLAYFLCLSALFIGFTLMVIKTQRQKGKKGTLIVLAVIVVVGYLSTLSFTRIDFTKEKRFTLSPVTRQVMSNLHQEVKVTVYLKGKSFQSWMKSLQRATRDMLSDLQAYSHGNLHFDFVDPIENIKNLSDDQQKAIYDSLDARGISGQPFSIKTDNGLSQIMIFPEALVEYKGQSIAVNLLQSRIGLSEEEVAKNSIQNLEYNFASAIRKITSGGKPLIGFTEGHNELNDRQLNDAMRSLANGFVVGRVDLKTIPFEALMHLRMLVIPKPDKPFTELEKFKIDQYVMRGGKVLWTIDQVSAELDSLKGHGNEQLSFPKQLNLDDQLFVYGVRINYDLIADMSCASIPVVTGNVGGQPQIQNAPWLFFPVIIPQSKNPVVKDLDGIRTEFVSTIDTIGVKGIKKTILLSSSIHNKKFSAPYLLSLQALEQEPDPKQFINEPKTVGVLLGGKFKSDFLNRPQPEGLTDKMESLPESKPTKMIVISDGDIFKNQVGQDGSVYPLGYDRYTQQTYGNKNLLLNIADYMTDDSGLIELRTKEIKIRLLDRAKIRSEKLYWQVINNAVPLAFVLIFAIFQHYIRRRKYAH
ncbi:gliding motility-associated ABC transporter substrate-binding protein GldG [Mucilaginibacter ginsenosidivorans]|uniref:Gliding motility-associated ABC transporter substrate-binding protein GldG n=1 Tax=Mucilaginibacter ginsenosidivorans TaxID=398053 RepID=A0A5B8V1Y1_9SPHI|nr:gliding motility-associated ABC transporter substrate-binding protein GldG [Mucilaginibacter ginsenosidivorans]QEC65149.1 gliding motility-associated ABC transporter substrate-binding protein GldG [Mucilaginibacter ginsenosidivorans]